MKIFKRMFCLMLLSVFAGFAESTPLEQEKTIEISSLSLKAIFSTLDKGRLEQLIDNYGREYLSPRNNIEPLWIVEACQIGVFTNKCVSTAKQAKNFSYRILDNAIELSWFDAGVIEKAVAVFKALPGDPSIRCRITVTPKSGWALVETQFPRARLSECLGTTPTDDAVVIGSNKGGIIRNPMNPRRKFWAPRQTAHSPGSLVAQFGCFYDDSCGLYTMAEDADGNEKELLMDRWWRKKMPDGSWGGDFLFRWSRFEYSETTDAQPYDIHLRGFKSPTGEETTWYDAADIYKQWAKNQFWCKKTFLEKTDFLPPWTREAPVLMRFNREWFDRPDFMYKWLDEYWKKKFPDAPLLAIFEGWEKHGDWIAPDYFPVYPSDEKFAEIISRLKAVNGHFWPWPGGHHWNIKVGKQKDGSYKFDFSKDFWERAAPHAVYGPDGKVALKNLVWLGGGYSASMCAGDMWSVNWWNKDIACELVKRGADLVQLDQDVGARIEPTCWATNHSHKPGPGRWHMHAQRHQVETMISEMRKINPDAMFSFEEMHEYFADLYAFADYRNCRWMGTEWASVYNYIYHEYTPTFQSGFEQHSKMFWLAHCAADGQMPRLPMALKFYENPTDEQKAVLDFVERWIVFHRGEGRKWLAHGRQLHPPRVECDTVAYHEKFRGSEIDKVMPAVFSSAWEAQDETRALVFVNATAQSRTLAYKWNNKWSKIEIEPYGLKLIQVK